jgi:pimeloyl-ACP methyl ester carboxylesterase
MGLALRTPERVRQLALFGAVGFGMVDRAAWTQLRAAGTPVLCDPPGSVAPHSHPGRKAVPRLQQHQARRSRPMLQHSILCFVGADVLHLMN